MLLEGGIRVPFLVVGPGVKAGVVSRVPVTGFDLLPTLYDLAGGSAPLPTEIDGGSFRPLLENAGVGEVKRSFPGLIFHRPKHRRFPASSIRMGDYKLLVQYATEQRPRKVALYNLAEDIGESRDLSADMPEKAAELERMLLDRLGEMGAETRADAPR